MAGRGTVRNAFPRALGLASLAALALWPGAALATEDAAYLTGPVAGGAWYEGFRGSTLVLEEAHGLDPSNPYEALSLTLLPAYRPRESVTLSARLDLSTELTRDDVNDHDHELLLSDLFVNAAYRLVTLERWGLTLSPLLRVYFPTSESSRLAGFFTGVRGGLEARWAGSGFDMRYSLFLLKNFRKEQHPFIERCAAVHTGQPARVDPRNPAPALSTFDESDCHLESSAVDWSWANQLWVIYNFTQRLSVSALYQLSQGYAYPLGERPLTEVEHTLGASPDDQLPATEGGERFRQSFSFELDYQFTDHFVLAAGFLNSQLPQQQPNGRDPYIPFLVYRNNGFFSQIYLDLNFVF